ALRSRPPSESPESVSGSPSNSCRRWMTPIGRLLTALASHPGGSEGRVEVRSLEEAESQALDTFERTAPNEGAIDAARPGAGDRSRDRCSCGDHARAAPKTAR